MEHKTLVSISSSQSPVSSSRSSNVRNLLPILDWLPTYSRAHLTSDAIAAVIVTIMLIPQSLAYALLAGLPAEMGLYASILPLVVYTLFGTSRALAVGPVAVVSLMTASAVGPIAATGAIDAASAAILLAFLSGAFLLLMGALRLGFLANFLSHPVIAGFITASGILIAVSQLKHILGVTAHGKTLFVLLADLGTQLSNTNIPTVLIGTGAIAALYWTRARLKQHLTNAGLNEFTADIAVKSSPVIVVVATTLLAAALALDRAGVATVGEIPQGLPPLTFPVMKFEVWRELIPAAVLISLIGFVESVSVAQTFAAKRRQRIVPNQELVSLGAANIASSLTGGYPVTGGFARSVVNFEAGAQTPAAGAFTAVGILIATLMLTPLLHFLPKATLAATIIVAVLSLVDFGSLKRTWAYSKSDFAAQSATILATLLFGVEHGIVAGIGLSIALHLWRTSQPHCAVVGLVPGTQHFRNIDRHDVVTSETVVTIRVDESLYFANSRFLEDRISALVADHPKIRHLILMCPAINHIDGSALESLESINRNLAGSNVTFHLSEVKGPVMDRLKRSHFLDDLTGSVFLSQFDAATSLDPDLPRQRSSA